MSTHENETFAARHPHLARSVTSVASLNDHRENTCTRVGSNQDGKIQAVPGPVEPKLIAGGWTTYLIKVHNLADVRVPLEVESPHAAPLYHVSSYTQTLMPENKISKEARDDRFLTTAFYRGRPMQSQLSGLELEYVVLQLYSRTAGSREASLSFHFNKADQGRTPDICVCWGSKRMTIPKQRESNRGRVGHYRS